MNNSSLIWATILTLIVFISFNNAFANELKSSWFDFPPYSFKKGNEVVGVDIDLAANIAKTSGRNILFHEMNWAESIEKIKSGELDILTGATLTDERSKFAFFSAPYRFESNSLVLQRHPRIVINFNTPAGFVEELKKTNFKLGTIDGYAYSEPVVADYVRKTSLLKKSTSKELMKEMFDGKIDGFMTDSNEARKIVSKAGGKLADVPTGMRTPIRFMLSKKTMTKKDVDALNQSIQRVAQSKLYIEIIKKYSD